MQRLVAELGGPAQTGGDIPGQPRVWSALRGGCRVSGRHSVPAALSLYPGVTGLPCSLEPEEANDVLDTRCLRTSAHGIGCTASRSQ